jgi:ABC-2 type transport system ATP-binding protein
VLAEHQRNLLMPVSGGVPILREALRLLDEEGISVDDAGLRRPTLDDVFLTLTGHAAEGDDADPADTAQAQEVAR